jgi:hypothetical protein
MQQIEVDKSALLQDLKANRKNHTKEYAEAMESYQKVIIEWFKEQLRLAKAKQPYETFYQGEGEPEDHTADYDVAIDMLEATLSATIPLTTQEFRQYVRDEWNWQMEFKNKASFYNVSASTI